MSGGDASSGLSINPCIVLIPSFLSKHSEIKTGLYSSNDMDDDTYIII